MEIGIQTPTGGLNLCTTISVCEWSLSYHGYTIYDLNSWYVAWIALEIKVVGQRLLEHNAIFLSISDRQHNQDDGHELV